MGTPEMTATADKEHGLLTVTVFNEDAGGPPTLIEAGPGKNVGKVIDEFYARIGEVPKGSDRLLCKETGEPVAAYKDLHIREYAAGRCGELVWTFARDTGGAHA